MTLREQAARIVKAIDADTRAHLAKDPLHAMTRAGLRVGVIELGQEPRPFCEGLSTTTGVVLYASSPGSRRENFTLLHEFAHTLVDDNLDAMSWLADQPDIGHATERLCNEIASLLLVPSEVIDSIVGNGPVRAQHLQQLHRETEASQVAIAIAISRRLTTTGAVMLIDRASHTVVEAILIGELAIFPSKGQAVPSASPLFRIEPGDHIHQRSWWETSWGERQDYYLDATASARRAYAVIAATDIWHMERFHGGDVSPVKAERSVSVRRCACGYDGPMTGFPCDTCDQRFCPQCKKCLCDYRNAAAIQCRRCALSYASTALVDGLCSECR